MNRKFFCTCLNPGIRSPGISRRNIPAYNRWSESIHGVDVNLIFRISAAIAEEVHNMPGFRLSYHSSSAGLQFPAATLKKDQPLEVAATRSGKKMPGEEVVQLYRANMVYAIAMPLYSLKGRNV